MFNATPFLKIYASIRAQIRSRPQAVSIQQNTLLDLVRKASQTKFGTDHDFKSIKSILDYQSRVPLRTYEKFWNEYWSKNYPTLKNCTWPGTIPYYALSSGTSSGTTKYIPISHEMIRSNTKGGLELLSHHVQNRPGSKIFGGMNCILGGSTDLQEPSPGIFAGDLSGIAVKTLPWWAKARYFPSTELALLKNWEEKISILAEQSLTKDIRMISGVPSWLLIFFEKLFQIAKSKSLKDIYPNLEMLVHGGVSFAPYYDQFIELLQGTHAEMREVYPASEGFIGVADRGFGEGMKLVMNHGIFYEFVPFDELQNENPTRHWVGNVEKDLNYAVVLTTCAGLWSYVIGDTVRFVDTEIPRILVTGRTSYFLSAFGEHLIAEEVEDAILYASKKLNVSIGEYSVGASFPKNPGDLGKHIYIIEIVEEVSPELLSLFSQHIDKRLCERNEDYDGHRAGGFGMHAPEIRAVSPGYFSAWMKKRGKFGGQNKVPRLISNQELFNDLLGGT